MVLAEKKMLLVDGDEGIRKSLTLFFRSRNYHLHAFENGTQALSAINKEPYDIIICEELLPDMNGLNFFKRIDNRCSETIKILITSYGTSKTLKDIRGSGIDYQLTKPFSGDTVEAILIRLTQSKYIKTGPIFTGKEKPRI